MIVRRLSPEEYPKLKEVAEGFVPDPATSIAVAALDGERIVGRMLVVLMPHLEGTWVADGFRNGSTGARMEREVVREMTQLGIPKLLAYTAAAAHEGYMERLGYKREPYVVWSKELAVQEA